MSNLMQNLGTKIGAEFKAHRLRIETVESTKVDKISGKGLSTEDYTTAEKSKLSNIEAGAQVNTVISVAGKTGAVSLAKSDVGLENVTNESKATMFTNPTFTGTATGTFSGSLSGNAATATTAANATKLNGQNWYWSGQGGQPAWLWGGSDGTNMYVYNPSNFSVNYANTAGNGGVTSVNGMTGAVTIATQSSGSASFTSSGTWTCPAGVTAVTITACGAGGGGSNGTASYPGLGWTYYGGGGGSSFPVTATKPVVPGTTYTIGIGSSGVNSNGGNTTFGNLFCAYGGNGGGPGRITSYNSYGDPNGYEGGYGGGASITGGVAGGSGGKGYWGAASGGLYNSNALSTTANGAGGGGSTAGKPGAMTISW